MTKTLTIDTWKKHPWNENNLVFQYDVHFLKSISNPNSTDYTDDLQGNIHPQRKIWEDIKKEGMRDPLLIVVGQDNKTIRLESGNHRIKMAIEDGFTHLPCAIFTIKDNFFHSGNGTHFFDASNLIDFKNIFPEVYFHQLNPKKVFLDHSLYIK